MCRKHKKCKLPPTDLGAWLRQAEEDREVANMNSVPSAIRCYHAQQTIEKLLKAAIIANVGEFQSDCPEIVRQRKQHPPREDIAHLQIPAYAWVLPSDFDFPFTHDLCKLWDMLRKLDETEFQPLPEADLAPMVKATKSADCYRYPAYRDELGLVVGYAPEAEVSQIMELTNKLYPRIRDYVIRIS